MFSIFFKSTGPVHLDCMPRGETISATYYINNCIRPVIRALQEQRPASGLTNMKIHHDNAKPHVAKMTFSYLETEGIRIIRHPPYSPDLAPCDFWLFDYIERNLSDQVDEKSLKREITKILAEITKEEYAMAFSKWLERMQLCINNKGDYFEYLINIS